MIDPGSHNDDSVPEHDDLPATVIPDTDAAARDAQGAIDWNAVRERLAAVGRRLGAEHVLDGASEAALLDSRARALARRLDDDSARSRMLLIRISLGGAVYAVEVRNVAAVVKQAQVALLPGARPPAVALASWRGRLLPALDIRALLGHVTSSTREFLVVGTDTADMALLLDEVLDMEEVDSAELQDLPANMRRSAILRGILSDGTPLLDIEEVMRLGSPREESS